MIINKTGLALSILQPWSWCIVNGYKHVENRTWKTRIRGLIGIHAGKGFDQDGFDWITASFPDVPLPDKKEFGRGGIVGRALLTDCVDNYESKWFFGPYGFIFTDAEPIEFIPCRGQLSFFRPQMNKEQ